MTKKEKRPKLWFEEPFENIRRVEENFHRMMAEMWRKPFEFGWTEPFGPRFWSRPEIKLPKEFVRTIPIAVSDTDKELFVRAALPEFSKDEIKLKVTENAIFLAAEKKKQKMEQAKGFFKAERSYGSASRMFTLPHPVKPEQARARFADGVLEIVLPKAVVKKEKEVKVE